MASSLQARAERWPLRRAPSRRPPLTRQGKRVVVASHASGSSGAPGGPLGAPPPGARAVRWPWSSALSEARTPLGVAPRPGIIPAAAAGTAGWNRPSHRGLDARVLAQVMHFASITGDDCGSSLPRDKNERVQICRPTATRRSERHRAARLAQPAQGLAQPAPDQRQGSAKGLSERQPETRSCKRGHVV